MKQILLHNLKTKDQPVELVFDTLLVGLWNRDVKIVEKLMHLGHGHCSISVQVK